MGKLALNQVTVGNITPMEARQLRLKKHFYKQSSPSCLEKTASWFKGIVHKVWIGKGCNQAAEGHEYFKAEQMKLDLVILQ